MYTGICIPIGIVSLLPPPPPPPPPPPSAGLPPPAPYSIYAFVLVSPPQQRSLNLHENGVVNDQ